MTMYNIDPNDTRPASEQFKDVMDYLDTVYNRDTSSDSEPTTHYHVVAFIDGCLNDYDSGPMTDRESARAELEWYVDQYDDVPEQIVRETHDDRFEIVSPMGAVMIAKIESCTKACDVEGDDS